MHVLDNNVAFIGYFVVSFFVSLSSFSSCFCLSSLFLSWATKLLLSNVILIFLHNKACLVIMPTWWRFKIGSIDMVLMIFCLIVLSFSNFDKFYCLRDACGGVSCEKQFSLFSFIFLLKFPNHFFPLKM